MTKNQKILAGVLVFQLLLTALVIFVRQPKAAPNEALLPTLAVESISSIEITDGQNNQVTLIRQGENWVLANSGDYPVITENVTSLVENLNGIRTDRRVANTSASHQRLEVAEGQFQRRVVIDSAEGDITLYIGSSPAASSLHVRLSNQDEVYLTSAISTTRASAQVSNWIDTAYVQVASADVQQVSLVTANADLEFTKDADGGWSSPQLSADESIDMSKWTTFLTAFTNLRMAAPISGSIDPSYGFNAPAARLTLRYAENEETITGELLIGAQDPADNNYYAKWSLSPYVVKIASFNAERIINMSKMDVLPTVTEEE